MKRTLALAVLLGISVTSFSQLLIKAKGGLSLSKLQRAPRSFEGEDNQVFKPAFHAGGAVEYRFKKKFSVQGELIYSWKGLKDVSVVRRSTGDWKGYGFNFHYVELPVLVRYELKKKFRVGLGPSVAYLVDVAEYWENVNVTDQSVTYTKFDFGLNGDLSYSFKRKLEVYARYNYGLKMVKYNGAEDPEIIGPGTERGKALGKNRTLQIGVSYVLEN